MLDLVEEYGELPSPPDHRRYFRDHVHYLIGWKYEGAGNTKLRITFDPPEESIELPVDKRPYTQWDHPGFPPGNIRLCKLFLDQLRLIKSARLRGLIASAHDYAKDLNATDIAFGRLRKSIDEKKRAIPALLSEHSNLRTSVVNELSALELEFNQSSLRNRFMMAHLRAQTEGRLYEQPQWCVDQLMSGTKRGLYEIVRLLVWEPLGSNRYRTLAEAGEPNGNEVSEWSKLFGYDETGVNPDVDRNLAKYLRWCFLDAKMTNEDFGRLHPAPRVNPDDSMDRKVLQILSGAPSERFVPGRLLPLFVFSLRAAFQHAWLTSFFKAARAANEKRTDNLKPVPEAILLSESNSEQGYEINVLFPNPFDVEGFRGLGNPTDKLPWGNWEQQIGHYRGLTSPWWANVRTHEAGKGLIITMQAGLIER